MKNLWNNRGISHKGWQNVGCDDLGTPSHTCEMCGQQEIRYVHLMYHEQDDMELRVGFVCAQKMTQDYDQPQQQLKYMIKRSRWCTQGWHKHNEYEWSWRRHKGILVGIYRVGPGYECHYDNIPLKSMTDRDPAQLKRKYYDFLMRKEELT